ncbi:MAG: CAP domain-containing protein [Chloroflexota bacterium]|nr:CAP domain-containing protein [Chloroflexota bacterium]
MQKGTLVFLLGIILLTLSWGVAPTAAQASDAYSIVAAVNDFRTANGLPALQIDNSLMAAAQAHSDYQASIGQVTHIGAGGSHVKDRAIAYGFGGGATVFVSENIAGGQTMTIEKAIYDYWQDSLHLQTMLNPNALYIGAGVANAGNFIYYTVDTGYYSGAEADSPAPTAAPGATSAPPPTSGPAIGQFVVSTPREDGSIVHIVNYGQSLIGIANTYEVEVAEVLKLNGMTLDDVLYPGDEITIRAAHTPTVTENPTTPAPTSTPSDTLTPPTATPPPQVTFRPSNTPTLSPTASPIPMIISPEREPMVVGVVLVSLVVLLGVIIGGVLKQD